MAAMHQPVNATGTFESFEFLKHGLLKVISESIILFFIEAPAFD